MTFFILHYLDYTCSLLSLFYTENLTVVRYFVYSKYRLNLYTKYQKEQEVNFLL